jgi:Transglutaminase-like superfamily
MRVALALASVMPARDERFGAVGRIRVGTEILATYGAARWWMLRLSFPESVAAAREVRPNARVEIPDDELHLAGVRLGNAVQRTLRALPVDSRCLVTALVLTRMLARRGIDSSFVLGVRSQPQFAAHAWVERNGVALLPTTPDFERLSEF